MPPPKELNLSENATGGAGTLESRLYELEFRNAHLQALVVELLDKNEQLRRALAQGKREALG
jgi:hypothetical protein